MNFRKYLSNMRDYDADDILGAVGLQKRDHALADRSRRSEHTDRNPSGHLAPLPTRSPIYRISSRGGIRR